VTLGESIAQARQQAGLSVDAVAERTRIRPAIIRALESDDLEPSGGPVYARGHVRSIATALGVDASDWLAQIGEPAPVSSAPLMSAGPVESGRRRNGPNWTLLMAVLLVMLVGLGAWQILAGDDDGALTTTPSPDPSVAATSAPAPSPSGATSSSPTSSDPASSPTGPSAPVPGGVVVVVTATGTSWISGSEGATQVFQGTLQPGESQEFTDPEEVRVVIGNAGAVELTVNGRDLGSPGGDGEVVRLTFGPGEPTPAAE
jgi:cytoskeletal protein RodZ